MFGQDISYYAAFVAGLLSFASPCVLPLIPAYFTFITGFSLDELTGQDVKGLRWKVMLSTLSFVLGFSFVFIVVFGAVVSLLGGLIDDNQDVIRDWIRIGGGVLIIILGIHVSGLFRLKFLDVEKRVRLDKKPVHFLGSFVVGMAFAAGWTPCIGPILGGIMAMAVTKDTITQKLLLMSVYSLGLAIPFMAISAFAHLILVFVRRANKMLKYVNAVAGVLLMVVGVLLIANKFNILT